MLLALDTATATAALAVYDLDADRLLAEWTWQARRRQTQDLLASAQHLLAHLNLEPQQLTALAVTTGPGSFTGIRIAISATKGIGLGLPTPLRAVGIPTLCVTAAPWLAVAHAAGSAPPRLCAFIQAGRGRFNWVLFDAKDVATSLRWRPTAADHQAGTVHEFAAALADLAPQPVWLVGEPTNELTHAVTGLAHVCLVDAISGLRRAGHLARLGALDLAADAHQPLSALQPLYLHAP